MEYKKAKVFSEKHLERETKLTTEVEKEQIMGTLELYCIQYVNMRRLNNITRKDLKSDFKLATEMGKQ